MTSDGQAGGEVRSSAGRRSDLDWLRVLAFGLLILFHVGLVYSPYDWHVRSRHTFGWMAEGILVTGPWRLTLLFLISGAALRFLWQKTAGAGLAAARLKRLGPPLAFGALVLVPVQSWIEAMDKGSWSGGFFEWVASEFGPAGLADGVPVNHLWFVLYIGLYSLIIAAAFRAGRRPEGLEARLTPALAGWRLIAWPVAYLFLIRATLFPIFGITNTINIDWYNHALSFPAVVFGFLIARSESVWSDLERQRRISLAMAALALPVVMLQNLHPGGGAFLGLPRAAVFALYQWTAMTAALGYGSRYLRNAKGPVLTYLNNAVFPCYLAHQTILVVAVWLIRPAELPPLAEAAVLTLVTVGGSLLTFEAVRRLPGFRQLWGLTPAAAPAGGERFPRTRTLLGVGVAAPVAALVSVALSLAAQPSFDHSRQYLSELGGASATAAEIFNAGLGLAGFLAGVAGIGFALALAVIGRARVTAALAAVCFVAAGVGLMLAAVYPWPDPRHMAINLGLGIQLAPLLLLFGLRRSSDLTRLKWFLGVVFVAMAVLTVLTKHLVLPGTVNDSNVGWWERGYAILLVGWVAVAAVALERRLEVENSAAPSA